MAMYHYFIHAEVYDLEDNELKGKFSVVADYNYQIDADNYNQIIHDDLYWCDAFTKIIGNDSPCNFEIVPVSINLIATYN